MLKMSLNEIRGKIQMYPENWVNMYSTNCYAYALGLDIRQSDICDYAYQPGTISETTNIFKSKYFSYDMLIKGIDEKLALNEWKIALFVDRDFDKLVGFHFLRQKENGMWLHKQDFDGIFSKKDYCGNNIITPSSAELFPYIYKKCYALRLEK